MSVMENAYWKLHINFDYRDTEVVSRVREALEQTGCSFKIGEGGGINFDQPGKEATIRVGKFSDLERVQALIEDQIGDVLLGHLPHDFLDAFGQEYTSEATRDDIPLDASGKIWARFDSEQQTGYLDGVQVFFDKYGPTPGMTPLECDELTRYKSANLPWGDKSISKEKLRETIERKTIAALTKLYGNDFIPNHQWLAKRIEARSQILKGIQPHRGSLSG